MYARLAYAALFLLLALVGCTSSSGGKAVQDAKPHYLLGASALSENDPTMALQEFLLAEKADPRDPDIQAGLAQAYMQKRAYELAEKHLKNAVELSDGSPQHYNNLGVLYLIVERYDDAIAAFRKAAENLLFASPEVAWTGVGYAYFLKHDYAAAERYYKKARELNPRYFQTMFRLGELYYSQDRMAEAMDALIRTIELAPNYAQGHYWLGLTAMKTQDNVLARKSFQETIKLAPDSEQSRLARSYLKILK